jgi:hypothetical protein
MTIALTEYLIKDNLFNFIFILKPKNILIFYLILIYPILINYFLLNDIYFN